MTPNPHSKTKMLSELVGEDLLVKQPSCKVDYDNFIFVDRVTNHKIAIGEAKSKYGLKNKKSTQTNQSHYHDRTQKKILSTRTKGAEDNANNNR